MQRRPIGVLVRLALVSLYLGAPVLLFSSPASAAHHHQTATMAIPRYVKDAARPRASPTGPGPVRDLRVHWQDRHSGVGTAVISFVAPSSDGGSPILSYNVTEGARSCHPTTLSAPLTCNITNLDAGVYFTFTVQATNAVNSSSRSVHSTLGAEGQSINFAPLADRTFDQASILLNATASSGLPVRYLAAGACTVTNSTLLFTSVGSCAVTASQDGSSKFQPAASVANYFQITQGTALVHMVAQFFTSNGSAHVPVLSVTPPVSGVQFLYCTSAGFSSRVCSSRAPSQPGVYRVTVSLVNINWMAKPVSTTETINVPPSVLPSNLTSGTSSTQSGTTHFTKTGVQVATTGTGFSPGHKIDVGVISEESMGHFIVPAGSSLTAWFDLLHSSSPSTAVISVKSLHAFSPEGLSALGSIAFPAGGFPGPGNFESIQIQSTGFVPHTTVSAVIHSSPIVLAQGEANANGVVTLVVPIAKSWAAQNHQLFLAGTYLVTTTTAGSDGSALATVDVSKSLLLRLVPGASVVVVFRDALDPNIVVSNAISLPSQIAIAAFVKATTPLHLSRFKPVAHPNQTMTRVTGAAAALSAVAAGIAVARAAGAAGGISSAAAHSSSLGARGASAAHRGSTETIEAVHHAHEANREHIGDHSFTWRFPGRQQVDDLSLVAPVALAKYSPLAAVSVADAGYWRAMFGSLSLFLPIAGVLLGVASVIQTKGWPLPPSLGLFLAIVILGFLDATAGIAAAFVTLIGAIATGHLFSLNMVISALLLATLYFGLPVMVKKIRPFIRAHPRQFQDWWIRGADLFIGPAFAGYLAAKLVDSFSLVSDLKIGLVVHGNVVGYVVGATCVLRYFVTTFVVFMYPKRLGEVTPPFLPEQTRGAFYSSFIVRLIFATLILAALLGRTWFVPPLVVLLGIGMLVRGLDFHLVIPNWCYRLIPRNLGKILTFEIVGTVVTGVVSQYIASPYWQIASLLFAIFLLGLVVDLLSAARGREWPVNWWTRLGGVALFAITVAQLSDNLIR